MQRIQLAEKLSDQRKRTTTLESHATDLQDQLASLTLRNEAAEEECAKMRKEIEEITTKEQDHTETIRRLEAEVKDREQVIEELGAELEKARIEISEMKESHESREGDLHQGRAARDDMNKVLRQEIDTLRTLHANAVLDKEAAEKQFQARAEVETVQAQKKEQELEEACDKFQEENNTLQQSINELQNATKPFPQLVVIVVDLSGSTATVFGQIKQAYRDVLHVLRANNSDAKVSVVIHGPPNPGNPSVVQGITSTTFRIMEECVDKPSGSEDYDSCLAKAADILDANIGSKELVVLIGDGNGCSSSPSIKSSCAFFQAIEVLVHSIIFPTHSWFDDSCAMQEIAELTGGRVERQESYLEALEEIFQYERRQHFAWLPKE